MSGAPFRLAPLDAAHDRAAFRSDSEPLNRYLQEQVTQDIRRRVAACFVALADGPRIAGYYTLASASLLLADLPASIGKSCRAIRPCPPFVWAAWLSIRNSRAKVSAVRFWLTRSNVQPVREIAAFALMVDAKDEG